MPRHHPFPVSCVNHKYGRAFAIDKSGMLAWLRCTDDKLTAPCGAERDARAHAATTDVSLAQQFESRACYKPGAFNTVQKFGLVVLTILW